jgi:hypothetical protein
VPAPQIAPLAPGIVLSGGYVVKLIAVDPTTGSAVSGVVVSNVSMQVSTADPPEDLPPPTAPVPPLFVYGTNQ